MTPRGRTAKQAGVAALGAALLAGVLAVISGSSALPAEVAFEGVGSTTVATQGQLGRAVAGQAPGQAARRAADDAERSGSQTRGVRGPSGDLSHRFGVQIGPVPLLYPGSLSRIPITFVNPQSVRLSVRTATLSATGPPSCPPDQHLILGTRVFKHKVYVPAQGTKLKRIKLGMQPSAPDGCQGAVFTLTVRATAIRD